MGENSIQLYKQLFKQEIELDTEALRLTLFERLKSIPYFGDILVFIEKRENLMEMQGLNIAIENLNELVEGLIKQNQVDYNYIDSNQREIYFLFKFFLNAVYNQPDEEFIKYLSNYVSNCINEEFSSVKIKVAILNKIAKYTKQHVIVLKSIYEDSKEHGWPENLKNEDYNWQKQVERISDIEPFIVTYCFNELVNDGFLFQKLGAYNFNTFSPYEITELGLECLRMVGVELD